MGEDRSGIKAAEVTLSDSARAAGPGLQRLQPFLDVLRQQSWFVSLALFYLALAYVLSKIYDYPFSLFLYSRFQFTIYLSLIVAFFAFRTAKILIRKRPERPLSFLWHDLKGDRLLHKRILQALPPLLLLPFALSAHTSIKFLIPLIQPFAWDYEFAAWDAALHGGWQPWELLQPILGDPRITDWIDYAYRFPWFWMVIVMKFWLTFTLDRERVRFLVSYVLCWLLLGSVAAILFSSVGPVYYSHLVEGPDPFAPLMSYLDSVGDSYRMYALSSQEYLWQAYTDQMLRPGVGISAMPSMHLSMGFFLVLISWKYHLVLRILSLAFLVVLQIGSVHLGWHYAIDGYVAIIGTYAIWWAVGRALEWRERRLAVRPARP